MGTFTLYLRTIPFFTTKACEEIRFYNELYNTFISLPWTNRMQFSNIITAFDVDRVQ